MSIKKNLVFLFFIIIFILFYINPDIEKLLKQFYFSDLRIFLIVIILFVLFVIALNTSKKVIQKDKNIAVYDDNYFFYNNETIKNNILVKNIEDIVTSVDKFFSIGIFGKWGLGKSSFFKNLEGNLEKKVDVIYLNVWELESTENIINEIKKELDDVIFKYTPLKWIFYHIENLFVKDYFDILQNKLNFRLNIVLEPTLKESQKRLSIYLNEATDKIVILIDEIDRLEKDEVLNVLKLIRYITPFDNIVIITALDLDKIKIDDKEFLYKIFNLKIELPLHSKNDLYYFFEKELKHIGVSDDDIFKLLKTEYRDYTIMDFIGTFREIKNILNDINIVMKLLNKVNKNFTDYIDNKFIIVMSILKNINFEVYIKLYENENLLVDIFNKFETELIEKMLDNKEESDSEKVIKETPEFIMFKILYEFLKSFQLRKIPIRQQLYVYKYKYIYDFLITNEDFLQYMNEFDSLRKKFDLLKYNEKKYKTEFLKNIIDYIYLNKEVVLKNKEFLNNFLKFIIENKNKYDLEDFIDRLVENEINNNMFFELNDFFKIIYEKEEKEIFLSLVYTYLNKYKRYKVHFKHTNNQTEKMNLLEKMLQDIIKRFLVFAEKFLNEKDMSFYNNYSNYLIFIDEFLINNIKSFKEELDLVIKGWGGYCNYVIYYHKIQTLFLENLLALTSNEIRYINREKITQYWKKYFENKSKNIIDYKNFPIFENDSIYKFINIKEEKEEKMKFRDFSELENKYYILLEKVEV